VVLSRVCPAWAQAALSARPDRGSTERDRASPRLAVLWSELHPLAPRTRRGRLGRLAAVGDGLRHNEEDPLVPTRWESLKTRQVQGVGGVTGKALALSLVGGAVYGVIKLVDLVTD
jgi:hypothetical protein